ncbi:MAG: hypothetical protein ACJAVV_001185 [Alphaproteobacteria bacterium]|jgi:hypothetical protein
MNSASAFTEQSIVNYGVSEHLKAEFEMLRDVEGNNGNAKFTNKTVDSLAQHLVCRNYGNLCYEFAHINWALIFTNTNTNRPSNIQQALLDFYWITQCSSSSAFSAYFKKIDIDSKANANSPITVISIAGDKLVKEPKSRSGSSSTHLDTSTKPSMSGITINIHEHSFTISATRANLLACFAEWLVCVVPDLLGLIENMLLGKGHNAIREFSSVLQKHIYYYLSEHLPPAKLQLRYRLLQSWYQDNAYTNLSDINDGSLLKFWQQHNTQEGYGKFSSVVKDSLSYQHALDITHTSVSLQYAVNSDDMAEELPDLLPEDADAQGSAIFSLAAQYDATHMIDAKSLLNTPKVLNKQQFELIELAARYPYYILPLVTTWLRLQVFGKAQHQIIQLVRIKRLNIGCEQDYFALCEHDYEDVKHACVSLMASNQQVLLAIVDVLITETPKQACLILLKLMSSMSKYEAYVSSFARMLDESSDLNINEVSAVNLSTLAQWQLTNPWLKDLLGQCRIAFKHINREGFTAKSLLGSHCYISSAERLFDLNKTLKQLVTNINNKEQHSAAKFEADRLIFTNEFFTLYSQDDK